MGSALSRNSQGNGRRARTRIALLAAIGLIQPIGATAAAQAMDGAGQDAEARQFEGQRPQGQVAGSSLGDFERGDMTARLERITTELRDINQLLDGVNRGEYLVGSPGMMVTMTRQDIAGYVTRGRVVLTDPNDPLHILGLDGTPQSRIDHLIRVAADRSAQTAYGLRERRQALWTQRDQLMRSLDADRRAAIADVRPGDAYDPNASYSAPQAACALPHSWRFDVAGMGSSVWSIDASGKASESGLGGARGTASFSSGSIRVDWTTGAYAGYFTVSLDADCSGTGTLQWTRSPTGPASFPVTFTSLGGGKQ